MGPIAVVFYREGERAPVVEWLRELRRFDRKAFAKCAARIRDLMQFGNDLRRPAADFLRNGIYELRAKNGRVQYRILYFFHGRCVAVLAHAITKEEDRVPDADIDRALERKSRFEEDPKGHSYFEETENV